MFHSPSNLKVYVANQSCDMRKSFDGLHMLVSGKLKQNPDRGSLFVFFNKKATLMKVIRSVGLVSQLRNTHQKNKWGDRRGLNPRQPESQSAKLDYASKKG